MHRLFETYEVVEQVLTYLDHISLRNARLVNSFWQSIIEQNGRLCNTYRQRLRLRQLRILLIGTHQTGKRALIESWCYASDPARKAFDPKFQNASIKLPQTEGEIWFVSFVHSCGGPGFENLDSELWIKYGESVPCNAYVLTYDVGSRSSFEDVRGLWRAGACKRLDNTTAREVTLAGSVPSVRAQKDGVAETGRDAVSMLASYAQKLKRSQWELDERPPGWPFSMVGRRRVLPLGLIATNCGGGDSSSTARAVKAVEGQRLADEMGVSLFEVDPRSEDAEVALKLPLRSFWRVYKKGWMGERAEQQRRDRASVGGHDVLKEKENEYGSSGEGKGWWKRWSHLSWQ